MAHNVYGAGRLALTGGVGTVGVTVYEADGSTAVARAISGIVELPANSGVYLATVSAADPRRHLWMQFDDGASPAQYSLPVACGILPADTLHINGSATPASRLQRSADTIVLGTVAAGATLNSIPTSSLDPAATQDDQFVGRVVLFNKDTATAGLRGQGARITDSSPTGVLTVTPLTTVPASGDTFTIT